MDTKSPAGQPADVWKSGLLNVGLTPDYIILQVAEVAIELHEADAIALAAMLLQGVVMRQQQQAGRSVQ